METLKELTGLSDEAAILADITLIGIEEAEDKDDTLCVCGKRHAKNHAFLFSKSTEKVARIGVPCAKRLGTQIETDIRLLLAGLRAINASSDARMNNTTLSIARDAGYIGNDTFAVYFKFATRRSDSLGRGMQLFYSRVNERVAKAFQNLRPRPCDDCKVYAAVRFVDNIPVYECAACNKSHNADDADIPAVPMYQPSRTCGCGKKVLLQLSQQGKAHYKCPNCPGFAEDPTLKGQEKICAYCQTFKIYPRRSDESGRPYWLCPDCDMFS